MKTAILKEQYTQQGIFTDPGKLSYLYNDLPDEIPELIKVVQNLMIHPMHTELYNQSFSSTQIKEEEQIRSVEKMLERIKSINPLPITAPRTSEDKLIGICRDHSLLLVSMLRHKKIPARIRVGFANYFDSEIEIETHWVTEYWDNDQEKWILVDPQIDYLQIKKHKITINPLDLERDQFYTAGHAWVESSSGSKKAEDFGYNKKWRGWTILRSSLIQDLLCLNLIEPLAWDFWGKITSEPFSKLKKEDKDLLDRISSLTAYADSNDTAIMELYKSIPLKYEVENSIKLLNSGGDKITEKLKSSPFESLLNSDRKEESESSYTGELSFDTGLSADQGKEEIIIRGARQNNLKGIDINIPKNKMTVITGVSGSGKSSLAFDTLYAEGRRRYMSSLSAYARRFTDTMEKPDLDHIIGVHPAIAIEQKTVSRNPRSTVGSISDTYDYLRVLYSQLGLHHCPSCGNSIESLPPGQLADKLVNSFFNSLNFFVNNRYMDISLVKSNIGSLTDDIDNMYRKNDGVIQAKIDNSLIVKFTRDYICPDCNIKIDPVKPVNFNDNSYDGSCPECSGLGKKMVVEPDLIITRPELSLLDGASPWFGVLRKKERNANWMMGEMFALAEYHKVDLNDSWENYPEEFKHEVLYGNNGKVLSWQYKMGKAGRTGEIKRSAVGATYNINKIFRGTTSEKGRDTINKFFRELPCSVCNGEKIGPVARLVTLENKRYPEVASMTIKEVSDWLDRVTRLNINNKNVNDIITDLKNRLKFLTNVGLHYLGLNRPAPTLSGGEGQRIRLATQLGSGLSGILYVLDEPSIGLHPRDHNPLIAAMKELSRGGNTVVVVEHNRETMLAADNIVDIGPGAGINGGNIVSSGSPEHIIKDSKSLTGKYLMPDKTANRTSNKPKIGKKRIVLKSASLNNLKNVDLTLPLGNFIGISGVSGSGKSSLISKTLVPAIKGRLKGDEKCTAFYKQLSGTEHISDIINVTQEPIGRTPRSNPATYVEILDPIRKLFASTKEAKDKELKLSHFSFNSKSGACTECGGLGKRKVEMNFLPDTYTTCPECSGKRYNREVLGVKWNGKSIADILEMDIDSAVEFFKEYPQIFNMVNTLKQVGLGYIKLGQSALTFSGGEAQRIKLAKELCKKNSGSNLYILDEPTTGLHFADVERLIELLKKLVDSGNTVVVIEHNMDVLSVTDWIIDLGPDGGDNGGYIIAEGTPLDIKNNNESVTGRFL